MVHTIGSLLGVPFCRPLAYADDITLLSGSCRGLQKMLDICAQFGHKWDICFNAEKSQALTLGGSNGGFQVAKSLTSHYRKIALVGRTDRQIDVASWRHLPNLIKS